MSYFEKIIIKKNKEVVKETAQIDHVPKTNNILYVNKKRYQVSSNVFDYDNKCIIVYVDNTD